MQKTEKIIINQVFIYTERKLEVFQLILSFIQFNSVIYFAAENVPSKYEKIIF